MTRLPLVRDVALVEQEVWVLCGNVPVGFMGMSANKMETLFLAPEFQALTVRGRSQLIVLQFRMRTLGFLPCFISLSLMQTTVSQVMSKALPRGSSSWWLMLL